MLVSSLAGLGRTDKHELLLRLQQTVNTTGAVQFVYMALNKNACPSVPGDPRTPDYTLAKTRRIFSYKQTGDPR